MGHHNNFNQNCQSLVQLSVEPVVETREICHFCVTQSRICSCRWGVLHTSSTQVAYHFHVPHARRTAAAFPSKGPSRVTIDRCLIYESWFFHSALLDFMRQLFPRCFSIMMHSGIRSFHLDSADGNYCFQFTSYFLYCSISQVCIKYSRQLDGIIGTEGEQWKLLPSFSSLPPSLTRPLAHLIDCYIKVLYKQLTDWQGDRAIV